MKEHKYLPLNLQFFAENLGDEPETTDPEEVDEGVNETGTADPEETGAEGTEPTGDEPKEPERDLEHDAMFANIRRQAEEKARRQYEKQMEQQNAEFAKMYEGYTNPRTGAPIKSAADYMEAVRAQRQMELEAQMEQAGVDVDLLNEAIANNPLIKEAEAITQMNREAQAQAMLEEDFNTIISLDPTVASREDVEKLDNYVDVLNYVQQTGVRLSDAYKIVNFERLAKVQEDAASQKAINQAKSKGHMTTPAGITSTSTAEDIPTDIIETWRDQFPGKSDAELKALYNKSLKAKG